MTEHARGGLDATELGCPHVERCPGCPLGTLPYAAGLVHKGERLEQALRRHPELDTVKPSGSVLGAASARSYRLRAKLVANAAGALGLFAAGSHDVVDIPDCRVQAPELLAAAAALRALAPLEIALRGVDLRLCDRGVLMCLVVEGRPDRAALDRVQRQLREQVPELCGLALNVARAGSVQLLGAEQEVLWGAAAEPHHLTLDGPWHYASHGAFTQVHAGQTGRLHARIEAEARTRLGGLEGKHVLELYAGSGSLALRLAARGARVTAVEAFTPALERIAQAAGSQGLQVTTWAGDAGVFLRERATVSVGDAVDVVLVNPPRRGLAPAVRMALAALRPRLISYVSCEPQTLARDLAHFGLLGYGASRLEAFDMIPWSDAVESLALLAPTPPPALRVLFEDATSVALFKPAFEASVPQGDAATSLLDRAREALGEAELAPVHRLEVGTSGVCWFARRPEHVAPLARALEQGELTYVALARGITHMKGKINRPIPEGGKPRPAVTRYRRTAVIGGHSLLELRPEHGKKRQIERHLASIGHPILGDARHGEPASNRHFEHRYGLDRPFLHCSTLRVPLEQGLVEIRAPLAGDLAAVLAGAGQARALAGGSTRG
jgi:tRNA/tmRNA/rRNA uracil-C5-methylase (TrmA/RlmC/RlmD family)/23S rRNA-/tRNA-specific pseudouridylate synthase